MKGKVEKSRKLLEGFVVGLDEKPTGKLPPEASPIPTTRSFQVESTSKVVHQIQFSTHARGVVLGNRDLKFLTLLMEHLKKEGYKLEKTHEAES